MPPVLRSPSDNSAPPSADNLGRPQESDNNRGPRGADNRGHTLTDTERPPRGVARRVKIIKPFSDFFTK